MTEALVTPSVLTWARRRRGMEVDGVASKLNVKPESVAAWEEALRITHYAVIIDIADSIDVPRLQEFVEIKKIDVAEIV